MGLRREGFDVVIWDFNGTLVDDLDLVVRAVNLQLAARSLPLLTVDRYREVFGFPIAEYYRRIGFDLSAEPIEQLSAEFHAAYAPGLMGCPLHPGVMDALEQFRAFGARQFVLSAMEEKLLHSALARLGIKRFFEALYGLADRNAASKLKRGRELITDYRISPQTALLIGDTDHDAEVAEALGISVALVGAGHQSIDRLQTVGCPVYASLEQLTPQFSAVSKASSA